MKLKHLFSLLLIGGLALASVSPTLAQDVDESSTTEAMLVATDNNVATSYLSVEVSHCYIYDCNEAPSVHCYIYDCNEAPAIAAIALSGAEQTHSNHADKFVSKHRRLCKADVKSQITVAYSMAFSC